MKEVISVRGHLPSRAGTAMEAYSFLEPGARA
ncbi:MAG: hypothetical protein QOI40_4307 [Alphaproteobacteria bacterium]|jgi:hypothetical protein|nr:hypothetical protein [Alphaproteobacteria bacterium]